MKNIEIHETTDLLEVICKPHREFKFVLVIMICAIWIYLNFICYDYYMSLQEKIRIIIGIFLVQFLGIAIFVFSAIYNSLIRNIFLKEKLVINKERIVFSNNFGKKIELNMSFVKNICFDLSKEVNSHQVAQIRLAPNLKPIIILKNHNDVVICKIMRNVKQNDVKYIQDEVSKFLFKQKIYFRENEFSIKELNSETNYYKSLVFVSDYEFYLEDRGCFNEQEKILIQNIFELIHSKSDIKRYTCNDENLEKTFIRPNYRGEIYVTLNKTFAKISDDLNVYFNDELLQVERDIENTSFNISKTTDEEVELPYLIRRKKSSEKIKDNILDTLNWLVNLKSNSNEIEEINVEKEKPIIKSQMINNLMTKPFKELSPTEQALAVALNNNPITKPKNKE